MLRFAGERVYGYDASNDRLLVSGDRGHSWRELEKPGPLVDLVVDPANHRRIVVASLRAPATTGSHEEYEVTSFSPAAGV